VRADLCEPTLGSIGEAVEDRARDGELEDAVAQELEPFVRRAALVRPRRVREDLLEARARKLRDETAEQVRAVGRVLRAFTPGGR
jgi:hypothetical protein